MLLKSWKSLGSPRRGLLTILWNRLNLEKSLYFRELLAIKAPPFHYIKNPLELLCKFDELLSETAVTAKPTSTTIDPPFAPLVFPPKHFPMQKIIKRCCSLSPDDRPDPSEILSMLTKGRHPVLSASGIFPLVL